jgi:hypothetical protein
MNVLNAVNRMSATTGANIHLTSNVRSKLQNNFKYKEA